MIVKELLKRVYIEGLKGKPFLENIIGESGIKRDDISKLQKVGMIEEVEGELKLTPSGRKELKIVFTGGVYDLIHRGHIETLNEAKSLGDILVVVIARDVTAQKWKRKPINHEEDRRFIVQALKPVDIAILGHPNDHIKTIERVEPDIVAIGADQHYDLEKLKGQLTRRGFPEIEIVRLKSEVEGLSTTSLINRILARFNEREQVSQISQQEKKKQ